MGIPHVALGALVRSSYHTLTNKPIKPKSRKCGRLLIQASLFGVTMPNFCMRR